MNDFEFGTQSNARLATLNPRLASVVRRALEISRVDFSVVETLRTEQQQRANIKNGVSWTMESKHLPNEDGLSDAADLYPWVARRSSHEWTHYQLLARAMFQAAMELGVQIRWGGFWTNGRTDMPHWELAK